MCRLDEHAQLGLVDLPAGRQASTCLLPVLLVVVHLTRIPISCQWHPPCCVFPPQEPRAWVLTCTCASLRQQRVRTRQARISWAASLIQKPAARRGCLGGAAARQGCLAGPAAGAQGTRTRPAMREAACRLANCKGAALGPCSRPCCSIFKAMFCDSTSRYFQNRTQTQPLIPIHALHHPFVPVDADTRRIGYRAARQLCTFTFNKDGHWKPVTGHFGSQPLSSMSSPLAAAGPAAASSCSAATAATSCAVQSSSFSCWPAAAPRSLPLRAGAGQARGTHCIWFT